MSLHQHKVRIAVISILLLTALSGHQSYQASAATIQGDVLFLFDTTGSMKDVLSAAQNTAEVILTTLADQCNPGFAVAQYRDWPPEDVLPWDLVQDVTLDRSLVIRAINSLYADGGGDPPESVGWALHQSLGIGWRPGSVRVVVLIGDSPPHDPDPGPDGLYGTEDDLPFSTVVTELVNAGILVIGVYTAHDEATIAYWNQVTNATAGRPAIGLSNPGELSTVLLNIVCQTILEHPPSAPPSVPRGSIRGTVFEDCNRDGLRDPDERPLVGITFSVRTPVGILFDGWTGDDGTYGPTALGPSDYWIDLHVPSGYTPTTPTTRGPITINGNVVTGQDFGLAGPGCEAVAVTEKETAATPPMVLPVAGSESQGLAIALGLLIGGGLLVGGNLSLRRRRQRQG